LPNPRPLRDFVPDLSQASTESATVVTVDDRVVVVLRADRIGGGVQVHDPERSVHTLPTHTPATPVSDHSVRAEFLAAADDKLTQMDHRTRISVPVHLGMPTITDIAGRATGHPSPGPRVLPLAGDPAADQ
jgi:hypothetical protein